MHWLGDAAARARLDGATTLLIPAGTPTTDAWEMGARALSTTPADPALLHEVSRAYRSFAQFQLSGTLSIETDVEGQPPQKIEAPIRMAGRRSGGVHENVVHPQIGMLTVSDGVVTHEAL